MADSVRQFWGECFIWAGDILWGTLWDPTAFTILVVLWIGLVLKNWNHFGWVHAGWMLFERVWLAMKALLWPAVGLAIVFVFIAVVIAPAIKYRDLEAKYQHLSEQSTKPQPVVKDEESRQTIIDLQQQLNRKDIEAQELKRLKDRAEDAASNRASEISALSNKLRDVQNKTTERARRKAIREQFGKLYTEGMALKTQTLNFGQAQQSAPFAAEREWSARTSNLIEKEISVADAVQFMNPIVRSKTHFKVPSDHENLANLIDYRMTELKAIMDRLSLNTQ